jgi:SPOR domain
VPIAPQASEPQEPPQTRVAATNPTQTAPAEAPARGGTFLVSVSSQDSEAAARESFRVEQGKYASVLGSRSPVIRQVNLADGTIKYRAMVGPYRTRQEAVAFCKELQAAGGQCFIPSK